MATSIIEALRTAITAIGGTPTATSKIGLLRQLVTTWGSTPAVGNDTITLLRELISALGGTPTKWTEMELVAQLIETIGGNSLSKYLIELYSTVASLAVGGAVLLDPLSLTNASVPEGSAQNTVIGTITNFTIGGTLSLVSTHGGRFDIVGGNLVCGATALDREAASSYVVQVQENYVGASNDGRITDFVVTVTNVLEVTLGALTVPSYTLPEDASSLYTIGFFSGTTSGSTLTPVNDASGRITIAEYSPNLWIVYVSNGLPAGVFDYETEPTVAITVAETHPDASNSGRQSVITFNVGDQPEGDTTAPTLSSPTGSSSTSSTADIGVTTDEANGVLYWVVTTSSTAPTAAQVKAAQTNTGSPAPDSGSQAISSIGAKVDTATGLVASTTYYAYFMHEDAAGNRSAVATSASFATGAVTLAALVLSNTDTHVAGTNPPSWKSAHDGDVEFWDSATSTGDMHQMRFRRLGGAWTTESYQGLDTELLEVDGGFTWPLYQAAQPFATGGLFEVQERRSRWVNGVMVGESAWSNTWSDTLTAMALEDHRYWRFRGTASNTNTRMGGSSLQMSVNAGAGFVNIATGRTYSADSTLGGSPVSNLFDGNASTNWFSGTTTYPHHVVVDFGAGNEFEIKSVKWAVASAAENYHCPTVGSVDYSDDGVNWTTYFTFTANWSGNPAGFVKEFSKP